MAHDNNEHEQIEKANRIAELENLVESYTRTERHLEENFDIASPDKIIEALSKQAEREDNIEILEEKLISGNKPNSNELEGLEKNLNFARGYMHNNKEHIDGISLENMKIKQQNRQDEMKELT